MRRLLTASLLAVAVSAGAQDAPGAVDRLVNDTRVESLRPYGLNLPPQARADKDVQYGRALRIPTQGHADFWRVGVVTPTLKPVGRGDRDYAPGALAAALHLDSARQVLDIGPIFILDHGQIK